MAEPVPVVCPECEAKWASTFGAIGTAEECPGCGEAVKVRRPKRIPVGEKDRCPACGSADVKPLGNDAVVKLYKDYKLWKPPILIRPRRCQACGSRWEVNLSRPQLLFVIGFMLVLAAGGFGLAAWAGSELVVIGADQSYYLKPFLLGLLLGVGCLIWAWHFFRKMGATPAVPDPKE